MDWTPLILTLKLASITTLVLLLISIPIAKWLANTQVRFKPLIETSGQHATGAASNSIGILPFAGF